MRRGRGEHIRRRKPLVHVEPLSRSQSLGAIHKPLVTLEKRKTGSGSEKCEFVTGSSPDSFRLLEGPQLLPPLGRKGLRLSSSSPFRHPYPAPDHHRQQLDKAKQKRQQQRKQIHQQVDDKRTLGTSSSTGLVEGYSGSPSTEPGVVPASGWADFADVSVQSGEAAGIAFQWIMKETMTPTAGVVPPVQAALTVVGVADGSPAAKHGGISIGMLLVKINRENVYGLDQDYVTRLIEMAAFQPRILTLARIASVLVPAVPSPAVAPSLLETRRGNTFRERATLEKDTSIYSSTTFGSAEALARQKKESSAAADKSALSRDAALAKSRQGSSVSSSVNDEDEDTSSAASSNSLPFRPISTSSDRKQSKTGSPTSSLSFSDNFNRRGWPMPSNRTIALRFVGSRGDITLFDRDHVLGLKTRDIEFIPSNDHGGARGSLSSERSTKYLRANSQRSLKDIARDWRNDPFSTPARRRRLIHEVCKVIVRSYNHASVFRVVELRREERFTTRIQAAFRMRSARRAFREKLTRRRVKAASVLQLAWLSCVARRRIGALREARDQEQRIEREKCKRQLVWDKMENSRREEAEQEMERESTARKRRQEQQVVVALQRRFRAVRETRRRSVQEAAKTREDREKKVRQLIGAVSAVEGAVWRRHQLSRQRLFLHQLKCGKIAQKERASVRIQRAWRQYKVAQVLDCRRQDQDTRVDSRQDSDSSKESDQNAQSSSDSKRTEDDNVLGVSLRKLMEDNQTDTRETPTHDRRESRWENWPSAFEVEPSLPMDEGQEHNRYTAAESTRARTASGALESSASFLLGARRNYDTPPAGMMKVTVRRGPEEKSLVTQIVVTESGGEGAVAATTPPRAPVPAESPSNLLDDGQTERTTRPSETARSTASRGASIVVGGGSNMQETLDDPPKTRGETIVEEAGALAVVDVVTTALEKNKAAHSVRETNAAKLIATDQSSPSPLPQVAMGNNITSARKRADQVAPEATSAPVASPVAGTNRCDEGQHAVGKATEHLFMEDTQVYLGCVVCGVKYLVEAVEPEPAVSTVGQPTTEVLYLCTTCGGTLKNNGEEGRWKRRRRPSSAPAAGRRQSGSDFFESGLGTRRSNKDGGPRGEDRYADEPVAIGVPLEKGESLRPPQPAGGGRSWRGGDSAVRLRYAHCARTIQHAYQNFRHRQYLRDWAFDVLRRWFIRLMDLRNSATRRSICRRAAVTMQSVARAASARARCSALRAARLRFWMKKASLLYGYDITTVGDGGSDIVDDYSPSPAAEELLREMNMPPSPPPLSPPEPALIPWSTKHTAGQGVRERAVGASESGRRIGTDRGRALAEALAPRMGRPPPGTPAALDVEWGEWGVGLSLEFPPSPPRCAM